jgi:hypothetical protein
VSTFAIQKDQVPVACIDVSCTREKHKSTSPSATLIKQIAKENRYWREIRRKTSAWKGECIDNICHARGFAESTVHTIRDNAENIQGKLSQELKWAL